MTLTDNIFDFRFLLFLDYSLGVFVTTEGLALRRHAADFIMWLPRLQRRGGVGDPAALQPDGDALQGGLL